MINVKLENDCTVRIISYIITHECLKGIVETIVSCFVTDGVEPAYVHTCILFKTPIIFFLREKMSQKKFDSREPHKRADK